MKRKKYWIIKDTLFLRSCAVPENVIIVVISGQGAVEIMRL